MQNNTVLMGRMIIVLVLFVGRLNQAGYGQSPETIREWLDGEEFHHQDDLRKIGPKVFSVFEDILRDPKARWWEVSRIFLVVQKIPGDRHRFIEPAIQHLTDSNEVVRSNAVHLLGTIGSAKETAPMVALLTDPERIVVNAAATALASIGGPREVIALDIWLRGNSHRDDGQLRRHVKKCRDDLQRRIVEQGQKGKS
jgi:hypothetical protein